MRKIYFYLLLLFPFLGLSQDWEEIIKFESSDSELNPYLGSDVAVDGDIAVVGVDGTSQKNTVVVFQKEEGNWVEQQIILHPDYYDPIYGFPSTGDAFGVAVAISGDYLAVGALGHSYDENGENNIARAGAVYIFKREGGLWEYQQKVVANNRLVNGFFGAKIAMDEDRIIVGMSADRDENQIRTGSVTVYKRNGNIWEQEQRIIPEDSVSSGAFGKQVDIKGGIIIVSASKNIDGLQRIVYIFEREEDIWVEQQKISGEGLNFGEVIAIEGNYMVVSQRMDDTDADGENPLTRAGAVYVFTKVENTWVQQKKLVASDREEFDQFGFDVSISGDYIVVGAPYEDQDENGGSPFLDAGSAYIFKRDGNDWGEHQKIVGSQRVPNQSFGYSVGIYGRNVIVGGTTLDPIASVAYAFELSCDYLVVPEITEYEAICSGGNITLSASSTQGNINWYDSENSETPVFTGTEFTTPELTETTSYWVEVVDALCSSGREEIIVTVNPTPELTVENTEIDICEGTAVILTATSDGAINWYDSAEATEPVFTGASYETPELFETTSYWVEAQSGEGCVSERIEIIVNVLPAPELEIENPEVEICLGSNAYLYAFSEGNVIFWYAEEDDTEYLYHGNNFIVEGLTETTTFWVEAYNLNTGCVSERIPVTVTVTPVADISAEETEFEICAGNTATLTATSDSTVNWYDTADGTQPIFSGEEFTTPILNSTTHYWAEASGEGECVSGRIEFTVNVNASPDAPEAQPIQAYVEGMILADFEVEHTGTLHWYADEELTIELPDTTPVVIHTTYYVTQSLGDCESEATEIMADNFLNTGNPIKDEFAYYPNPVQDRLNFKGSEKVQSVQIFDMSGRLMMDQTSRNSGIEQLDVSSLPKGSYVVKAQTESGMKTFKIVKR